MYIIIERKTIFYDCLFVFVLGDMMLSSPAGGSNARGLFVRFVFCIDGNNSVQIGL